MATRDGLKSLSVFGFMVFAELAAERLIHQGVDGLCDADDAGEDDAPPVAVEAVGGCDGDDAERDARAEAGKSHVVGGYVLLERLHQGGRDEGDDAGGVFARYKKLRNCKYSEVNRYLRDLRPLPLVIERLLFRCS